MTSGIVSVRDLELRQLRAPGGADGRLVALEAKDVGFPIIRTYHIFGVPPDAARGSHAHRVGKQFFMCLHGSCRFRCDDGTEARDFILDDPTLGLYVPPMIWGEQVYLEPGSVALVLADMSYDRADYIESYDEFLELVGRGRG